MNKIFFALLLVIGSGAVAAVSDEEQAGDKRSERRIEFYEAGLEEKLRRFREVSESGWDREAFQIIEDVRQIFIRYHRDPAIPKGFGDQTRSQGLAKLVRYIEAYGWEATARAVETHPDLAQRIYESWNNPAEYASATQSLIDQDAVLTNYERLVRSFKDGMSRKFLAATQILSLGVSAYLLYRAYTTSVGLSNGQFLTVIFAAWFPTVIRRIFGNNQTPYPAERRVSGVNVRNVIAGHTELRRRQAEIDALINDLETSIRDLSLIARAEQRAFAERISGKTGSEWLMDLKRFPKTKAAVARIREMFTEMNSDLQTEGARFYLLFRAAELIEAERKVLPNSPIEERDLAHAALGKFSSVVKKEAKRHVRFKTDRPIARKISKAVITAGAVTGLSAIVFFFDHHMFGGRMGVYVDAMFMMTAQFTWLLPMFLHVFEFPPTFPKDITDTKFFASRRSSNPPLTVGCAGALSW